jgi:hypothetical protein
MSKRVGTFNNADEVAAILDLMGKMMAFQPEERLTVDGGVGVT